MNIPVFFGTFVTVILVFWGLWRLANALFPSLKLPAARRTFTTKDGQEYEVSVYPSGHITLANLRRDGRMGHIAWSSPGLLERRHTPEERVDRLIKELAARHQAGNGLVQRIVAHYQSQPDAEKL